MVIFVRVGRSPAFLVLAATLGLAGCSLTHSDRFEDDRDWREAREDRDHGRRRHPSHSSSSRSAGRPYYQNGTWYRPRHDPDYDEVGIGVWYGREREGWKTANGERFDPRAMTAAHTTLPFDSLVEVTNLTNGRRVVLRINDRGPFDRGRIIDVSEAAAIRLGFHRQGTARVRVRYAGSARQDDGPGRRDDLERYDDRYSSNGRYSSGTSDVRDYSDAIRSSSGRTAENLDDDWPYRLQDGRPTIFSRR